MEISKKDWKLFREKFPDWQEHYMEKLNQEYIELLQKEGNASDKFWELEKRIRNDKKKPGVIMEWVSSGRSPYDNGLNIFCDGYPLDFIGALHIMQGLEDGTDKVVNYQYDTVNDEVYIDVDFENDEDMELPF